MKKFNIASEQDILDGLTSDVYFERSQSLVKAFPDVEVTAEITVSGTPFPWIVFSGLDEVVSLLKGKNISLKSVPEGTVIKHRDPDGIPVPFVTITGTYREFARLETIILGFLCQSSGISTYSSMVRMSCGDSPFYSFGIRRMHPAISPMIDRAAFIGGADGVSGIMGAKLIGQNPVGTVPHAISLIYGDDSVWKAIAGASPSDGVKVALIDTFYDERMGAIKAAEMIPDLNYVRLDTPSSRRGNFPAIVREVRWELDLRGFRNVKIMVSGGLEAEDIPELKRAGADAFGVGTSIASGKTVDFSLDIVEVRGKKVAKKGKFSGAKTLLRCPSCHAIKSSLDSGIVKCECGETMSDLQKNYIIGGKALSEPEHPGDIRNRAIAELQYFAQKESTQ